jgi:hypothetical protein
MSLDRAFVWAQKDSNLRPTDYESAALTAELWARMAISRCSDGAAKQNGRAVCTSSEGICRIVTGAGAVTNP